MRGLAALFTLSSLAACAFRPSAGLGDETDAGGIVDARDGGNAHDGRPSQPDAADLPPPTWSSDMTQANAPDFYTRMHPGAAVELDVADPHADDGRVARLVFRGVPGLGTYDRVGPPYASELGTVRRDFHFGTYRMRARLGACTPGEEVVNGLFTYFNDGADHDDDGLVDNSEIDLEILCGRPDVLFMTVWTEYSPQGERFRRWTRAIDFATGEIWEAPSDREYGLDRIGQDPSFVRPELLDPGHFVELGFEWRADRVRYFAVIDGSERTLGQLIDATRVPQLPAALMFNVWHPAEHWFGDTEPPDFPAQDATLLVDWARYWR